MFASLLLLRQVPPNKDEARASAQSRLSRIRMGRDISGMAMRTADELIAADDRNIRGGADRARISHDASSPKPSRHVCKSPLGCGDMGFDTEISAKCDMDAPICTTMQSSR
jgi:hypothetical protein